MATRWQMWRAMFRQRCPNCRDGKIYRGGLDMNSRCPVCDLKFEREPGYFVGAMYVSYALASFLLLTLTGIGWLLFPTVDIAWVMLGAIALFLPLAPMTTRYSRVVWIYFDRWVWPPKK